MKFSDDPFPAYRVTSDPWKSLERRLSIHANLRGANVQSHQRLGATNAESTATATGTTTATGTGSQGVVAVEDTIEIIHTEETIALTDDGLSFTWYQCSVECWWDNGSNWTSLNAPEGSAKGVMPVYQKDVGSFIRVEICYRDPENTTNSCYFGSATVEVLNFNDQATGMPLIEGNPTLGATLSVNVSDIADVDGLPLLGTSGFEYQWIRIDSEGTQINVGDDATYDVSVDDFGHTLILRVSFVDLYGHGESVESEPTHIGLSNQPPVAVDTYVSTSMGQSITFNLMATDANGDTLTYQLVDNAPDDEPAPSGTLSIQTNGVATYTPVADFTGIDRFYFSVADGLQSSPAAVVNITVHEGYLAGTSNSGTPIQPTMLGHTLMGEFTGDDTGAVVAFDYSGTIMAVSSPGVDDSQTGFADVGHVAVYVWDDTDHHWQQRGNHLLGATEGDKFGSALALSGDGNVLAVAAPDANYVQVYRFDVAQNQWLPLGHQIVDSQSGDSDFDYSLAFNADASVLAIGAPNAEHCEETDCKSMAGVVTLYRLIADNSGYIWLAADCSGHWLFYVPNISE